MYASGLSTSEGMAFNSLSNSKSRIQTAQIYTDSLSSIEHSKVVTFSSCYEKSGLMHRWCKLLCAHLMIGHCDIWRVLQQKVHPVEVILMYSTVKTGHALQHITVSGCHATCQVGALHTKWQFHE